MPAPRWDSSTSSQILSGRQRRRKRALEICHKSKHRTVIRWTQPKISFGVSEIWSYECRWLLSTASYKAEAGGIGWVLGSISQASRPKNWESETERHEWFNRWGAYTSEARSWSDTPLRAADSRWWDGRTWQESSGPEEGADYQL